jgi:hypothetical protein
MPHDSEAQIGSLNHLAINGREAGHVEGKYTEIYKLGNKLPFFVEILLQWLTQHQPLVGGPKLAPPKPLGVLAIGRGFKDHSAWG